MPVNPLQIPSYATPQGVDFSSLANLGNVYQKAQQDQFRKQTLADLAASGTVDPQALVRAGLSLNDLGVAGLGVNMSNRQADDSWRREEATRAQRNTDRSFGLQEKQFNASNEGPEETAAQRAAAARSYGVDPATPAGKSYILTGKLPEADTTFNVAIEQRKQAAIANGLDPTSPGFQSFVLTGKMPREDAQPLTATDKKAILEADEGVLAAKTAVGSLDRALALSEKAFSGPYAAKRGYAASFLGETSDIGKAGAATTQLDNEVTTNAVSQLKAIFGGAPTEGERKILLDIQGSSTQPHAVRKEIFARAKAAAEARLRFNEQRANELRGGQFYKPQGGKPSTGPTGPTVETTPGKSGVVSYTDYFRQ